MKPADSEVAPGDSGLWLWFLDLVAGPSALHDSDVSPASKDRLVTSHSEPSESCRSGSGARDVEDSDQSGLFCWQAVTA